MRRDEGFTIADVASDHFDDDKVRRLWRMLAPDSRAMCEAMTLRMAVLLESWGQGRRVTLEQAAPLWLPIDEALVGHLVEVGLLDRQRKVPARSWTSWFEPALLRREARRESGRLGGLAKSKRRSGDATATPKRRSTRPADRPVRPSSPSGSADPSSADALAPKGAAPRVVSFREGMAAAGVDPKIAKDGGLLS